MRNRNKLLMGLQLLILMEVFLSGQSVNAKIFGKVTSADGGYLPGVEVTATHIESNAVTTTTSGKKGAFRFLALPPGTYQVSFDQDGYQSYVLSGMKLAAEQSITLRIKLKKK